MTCIAPAPTVAPRPVEPVGDDRVPALEYLLPLRGRRTENADWNVPQPVSIAGVDDAAIDGPVVYDVSFAVQSTDACYGALSFDRGASNADNDVTSVAVSGVAGPEADVGTSAFAFDLTLADAVPGGVSVTYGAVDGTAHAGIDYLATSVP